MYMGRSEFGNETDRTMPQTMNQTMPHALDNDLDMLDDLERAKHYKTNIMQGFDDRQSGYSTRYVEEPYFIFGIDNRCNKTFISYAIGIQF